MNERREKLLELYNEYKDCAKCPLHEYRVNMVFGKGNPDAGIMLIGEAPGREEDLEGAPFVGKSGKDLFEAFSKMGIDRKDIFVTNMVKCRPVNNRAPDTKEINICSELLKKQIDIISPDIIVIVGKVALDSLLVGHKISEVSGKFIIAGNRILFFLIHPAALFRNGKLKPAFDRSIINLKNILDCLIRRS